MVYTIRDIITNQPLPGTYLFQGEKDNPTFSTFANSEGQALWPFENQSFKVSMLGYKDLVVDPVDSSIIYLEPMTYLLPGVTIRPEVKSNNYLWAVILAGLLYSIKSR
jgi:hypothetical protein